MPSMSDREKHRVFTQALRGVRPGEKVKIPKKAMRSLPRSYEGTMVGTPPSLVAEGAREQYRGPYNRHVYETADSWVVHRDSVDPRQDPIGHLATDAPEWGAGFLAAGVFGFGAARSSFDNDLKRGADRNTATLNAVVNGLIVGVPAGVLAFGAVRLIRTIFGED